MPLAAMLKDSPVILALQNFADELLVNRVPSALHANICHDAKEKWERTFLASEKRFPNDPLRPLPEALRLTWHGGLHRRAESTLISSRGSINTPESGGEKLKAVVKTSDSSQVSPVGSVINRL